LVGGGYLLIGEGYLWIGDGYLWIGGRLLTLMVKYPSFSSLKF
jgi:hypothetical protein